MSLEQTSKEPTRRQVMYQGRYVDHDTFRVFVYGTQGSSCLAESYPHYTALVSSGQWFATKAEAASVEAPNEGKDEINMNRNVEAINKIKSIKSKVKKTETST